MLWPFILPLQITCGVLLLAVGLLTAYASPKRWSRMTGFFFYSAIALVAFIPSCTGIMLAVDGIRFGDFSYLSYGDIPDARSQRYLPEAATNIRMRKHANGYLASYKISTEEFSTYLDALWDKYGEDSAVGRRGFSDEGTSVDPEMFNLTFGDLGWACPSNATIYYSPRESDGGGATYYLDAVNGIVFQQTGFW
jgi:hypothetical protein